MKTALRGAYLEYVLFAGVTEKYPQWFEELMEQVIYQDDNRYTFFIDLEERMPDYYEKTLIEDYSVFLRKPNGDIFVTNYDTFQELYVTFIYDAFTHSGIAAFEKDCIEYVECKAGVLKSGYPDWFYEHFTEAINFPGDYETILFYDTDMHCLNSTRGSLLEQVNGEVSVNQHCIFLRNRFGEIRGVPYADFLRYYDPNPTMGGYR